MPARQLADRFELLRLAQNLLGRLALCHFGLQPTIGLVQFKAEANRFGEELVELPSSERQRDREDHDHGAQSTPGRRPFAKKEDRQRQAGRQKESDKARQMRGADDDGARAHAANHESEKDLPEHRDGREHGRAAQPPGQTRKQRPEGSEPRPVRAVFTFFHAYTAMPPPNHPAASRYQRNGAKPSQRQHDDSGEPMNDNRRDAGVHDIDRERNRHLPKQRS